MLDFVTGGAASGKSEYAERAALRYPGRKIYLATMYNDGSEAAMYRVRRHRKLREGKGFETLECPFRLGQVPDGLGRSVILLEDLPNLLANELYMLPEEPWRPERILDPLFKLASFYDTVVVSADVFSDGGVYTEETQRYIAYLSELHERIAASPLCRSVTEVVCGIPIRLKNRNPEV